MVMVSEYIEELALPTQLHHIASERLSGLSWYSYVTLATLWQRDCGYLSPSSGHRISMFHVHEAAAAGKYYTSEIPKGTKVCEKLSKHSHLPSLSRNIFAEKVHRQKQVHFGMEEKVW